MRDMIGEMLDGAALLWAIQVIASVVYVAWDIRKTPEATVMKWAFVIFTAYSGLVGALLYVLACREPLPGTHERYVAARWRQVVGSTMHCVAGDGIGILATAAIVAPLGLVKGLDLGLEYAVGFVFGWTIFQALFMRSMATSYGNSLRTTLLPEFLSMNGVMAGMMAVSVPWMVAVPEASDPAHGIFWFVMSLALCAGFVVAYPVNWWLVARGLKHGMMTVRSKDDPYAQHAEHGHGRDMHDMMPGDKPRRPARRELVLVTTVSLAVLAAGTTVAGLATSLTSH